MKTSFADALQSLTESGKGAEPDYYAVFAPSGAHIGLWEEKDLAKRECGPGYQLVALWMSGPPPSPPVAPQGDVPEADEIEHIANSLSDEGKTGWSSDLKVIASRLRASRATPVGADGWKMVPVKATRPMIEAGYKALMDWDARTGEDMGMHEIYDAMLSTVPKP